MKSDKKNYNEIEERISKNQWKRWLLQGEFGIEKESLRVREDGVLADTDHPDLKVKNISMDFSESQVEFISDVHTSIHGASAQICIMQDMVEDAVRDRNPQKEYVWTYSNPPIFQEDQIRIANFAGEMHGKTTYRQYLADKYGKAKMLYSGVHLNYSIPKPFFEELCPDRRELQNKKNHWYLQLSDRIMSDDWLLVALTAASPVAGDDFLQALQIPPEESDKIASFRNSCYGYWNLFLPSLSYEDYESYLGSMEHYIESGEMDSIQELYYPIRLKPLGANTLENLREKGVNHMELRMLDLNPMVCAGVQKKDLVFSHLLIAYRIWEMMTGENTSMTFSRDSDRILIHQQAARKSFWEDHPQHVSYALDLLERMELFYQDYTATYKEYIPADYDIHLVLEFEKQKILKQDMRYASAICRRYRDDYIGTRMKEARGEL